MRTGAYGPVGIVMSTFPQIGVRIMPGSITATRMPNGATSTASDSLRASSAHFDAQ